SVLRSSTNQRIGEPFFSLNGRLIGRSCDRSHRWRGYRRIPQKRYAVSADESCESLQEEIP
ncbi:hypothetical protein, partial [Slackia piriformis]|uniref:hypothetical protein n=1 Tax=Slackia piriformis TaxID=626934 RepID=UPI002F933CB0